MTTLLVGPGVKRAEALASSLAPRGEVLTQENPHLLHEGRLRERQVREVVYLPDPKHWTGVRSEAYAVHELLEACHEADVDTFVLLSSHRVYGPSPQHSLLLPESTRMCEETSDASLRALIDIEQACTERIVQGSSLRVVVLRPVYILGRELPSFLEDYLDAAFVPTVFGFNPLVQVVHARDVMEAVALSLERAPAGIYHVTGAGAVPLSTLAKERSVKRVPLFGGLGEKLNALSHRARASALSNAELPFLMHVLSVNGSAFCATTGYAPQISLPDTLRDTPPVGATPH
jgi:UDP-glucose 4-epimerase